MESQPSASHLCTRVTHVLSGEARYFREWARLIGFLVEAGALAIADQGNRSRLSDRELPDTQEPGLDEIEDRLMGVSASANRAQAADPLTGTFTIKSQR